MQRLPGYPPLCNLKCWKDRHLGERWDLNFVCHGHKHLNSKAGVFGWDENLARVSIHDTIQSVSGESQPTVYSKGG